MFLSWLNQMRIVIGRMICEGVLHADTRTPAEQQTDVIYAI